jgi:hypothetical protein
VFIFYINDNTPSHCKENPIYVLPEKELSGLCRSQTHDCGIWDWGRALPFRWIFVSNFWYCAFAVRPTQRTLLDTCLGKPFSSLNHILVTPLRNFWKRLKSGQRQKKITFAAVERIKATVCGKLRHGHYKMIYKKIFSDQKLALLKFCGGI